jgi:hypothetical protein
VNIDTIVSITLTVLLLAAVGAVVTLATLVITEERRYRRDRAAIEHADAMDAIARAVAADPEPETIDDIVTRHAFDALDGLNAEGIEWPTLHAAALARRILTISGLTPDPDDERIHALQRTERRLADASDALATNRPDGPRRAATIIANALDDIAETERRIDDARTAQH